MPTLSMILKLGGKVNRAPNIARMLTNIISKNNSPLAFCEPYIVLVSPVRSQNKPAATTQRYQMQSAGGLCVIFDACKGLKQLWKAQRKELGTT